VSWTAPLARVDGTAAAMTEINSYNIYYGTAPTALTQVVHVPDAYTFTYTVGSLAVSTYYFAVTAIDSKGVESAFSNIVTRIVK
jgi:fibronectin type 3 domain-containing protein